ncbi:MerC domain-containing protein [Telluribacter sp. SYSU D00476]|uniref:MerC domain-containing protein n=1 Tax=Telluribacter sp. SYSU D00476 TaxID=2811430 RepID=UPI001FF3C61E|nr:MerC domain-containing protein [Telluribacter sp. SYSU D00476]
MKPSPIHTHGRADYVGIAGSLLCIVHCLLTPVLAVGSSLTVDDHTIAGFLHLDYLFVLVNGLAVYYATRGHKFPLVKLILWLAFGLFAVSILLEGTATVFVWLGYIGSGVLIAGHAVNLLLCRPWMMAHK